MVGYATKLAFVHCIQRAMEARSFCEFKKITFCDFTAFSIFWHKQTYVCKICLIGSNIHVAYTCPNMINFNAVDFGR